MKLLELNGEIVSIGDSNKDDLMHVADCARILIRHDDGRMILISGLTRDECRSCVPGLLEKVSVSIDPKEQGNEN